MTILQPGARGDARAAFGALAVIGGLVGWVVARRGGAAVVDPRRGRRRRTRSRSGRPCSSPWLSLSILVLTNLARRYLGHAGLYALAAIMGVTDVDPFILGLAQGGPAATPLRLAATAIVIAAASNNVIKAIYAYAFADRATGRRSLLLLLGLAILRAHPTCVDLRRRHGEVSSSAKLRRLILRRRRDRGPREHFGASCSQLCRRSSRGLGPTPGSRDSRAR